MVERSYILSFTAASAMREESRRLLELFAVLAAWQAALSVAGGLRLATVEDPPDYQ